MILKAKERGDGKQLGLYLLRDTNEHVEVHELRGFVSDDLPSALQEIDAISRGTRAKNSFFSMSLNPPPNERVSVDVFEAAIETIEQKLGLDGQPRAIVFHEKDGRRHAHVVWSRIDTDNMKAINLSHYKMKLRDVSREIILEQGWKMLPGLMNSKERDPTNFTREEWEQAKRTGHDPKALKQMFQECWAASDSRKAFASALQARGYTLARGDRRGHVAVDYRGEVYAIARYAGVKTKQVRGRLGDENELPSVQQAKSAIAARMTDMLKRHVTEIEAQHKTQSASLAFRRNEVVQRQRDERDKLKQSQEAREAKENAERAGRIRHGFRGLWDRLTGKHAKARRQNEMETLQSQQRDRSEKERLVHRQLDERRSLHQQIKWERQAHTKQVEELHRDIASYMQMGKEPPSINQDFERAHGREKTRSRRRERDFEPEH